ncbi:MAG TPA: FAD-dependent oxidoreductase [Xanthomonadales bacterium]|nr:FAD-dependent oxidoreductase [Xanthomonadales bacterium]
MARDPSLHIQRGNTFSLTVNQSEVKAYTGETIATVVLAQGITCFNRTQGGQPRGPYCNMGSCYECQVWVVDKKDSPGRWVRACMAEARPGMHITTGATLFTTVPAAVTGKTSVPPMAKRIPGPAMTTDLLIIGAGPAGMAAAEEARAHGLAVTVVDEQAARGGQFLRQPPTGFALARWLPGKTYRRAKQLLARSEKLAGVQWLQQATVAGIFSSHPGDSTNARHRVLVEGENRCHEVLARTVLVATGCYDLPVAFPGWNTPGVMAAGGIQAFIKSQQFVPGQRFVLAGSHPLQLVIADQIIQAGGTVAAVLFSQPRSVAGALLRHPITLLRQADKLTQTAGILLRLRRAGVPVRFGQTVVSAQGDSELNLVTTAAVDSRGKVLPGSEQTMACDRLGVCFSFLSSTELLRQMGAECAWNARRGGWIAQHDRWMQSSAPGVFVAGETTGVAGSDAAMEAGRLAALGCALQLGKLSQAAAEQLAQRIRQSLQRKLQFAEVLSRLSWPGDAFLDQFVSGETTVCKCEELTAGKLQTLLRENPGIDTASAAKLLSRAGMGLCQGRYCHHTLTRLVAGVRGLEVDDVAGFTSRFPAKPITIGSLLNPGD